MGGVVVFPAVLGDDQQRLLQIIWAGYVQAGQWPKYFWVEAMADKQNLDASEVAASLPVIGSTSRAAPSYELIQASYTGPNRPQAGAPVALTIAGLHYIPTADRVIRNFFQMLEVMATLRAEALFDPVQETTVQVTASHLAQRLGLDADDLKVLKDVSLVERITGFHGNSPDEDWARQITREIRGFTGITTVEQYTAAVAATYIPPAPAPQPNWPSPFALNAALDYFNAVWMLRFDPKRPVLRLSNAERTGKLGVSVSTQEEFYSRLSALGEILKCLDVPGTPGDGGGHALARLPRFLKSRVAEPNEDRIERATAVLDAIRLMRDSGQHNEALVKAMARAEILGISFPIADWPGTWMTISAAAIEALDALREEIGTDAQAAGAAEPAPGP